MSQGRGALMTPDFVYEAVGPSGGQELFAAQRFAGKEVHKAAAKEPLLAADAITRGLLGPMQPLMAKHESYLSNEMLYLRAAKDGYLAPDHKFYANATEEASAAGVADTSMWRVPNKQDDLLAFIQVQDQLRAETAHPGVRRHPKKHHHSGAPSAAPGAAPHTSLLAQTDGAKWACMTTNTPFPQGWMAPGALKPTGVCGDLGAFDCSDTQSPVAKEFQHLAAYNRKSAAEADAACRAAQSVCHDAGCPGVPKPGAPQPQPPQPQPEKRHRHQPYSPPYVKPDHHHYGPDQCFSMPYDAQSGVVNDWSTYYSNNSFMNPYDTNSVENEF